jgi:NADH-quinone oxidoreductase subunit E
MLSAEEIREVEPELALYPTRQAACLGVLRTIQRRRGWLSDGAIRDAAEFLGMNPHELDAIATFYNLLVRKPVGRHVIRICDSVSCWVTGYDEVVRGLTDKLGVQLGDTTADGRFTLLPSACLGVCERAPALMIDDDVHGNLSVEAIDEILARYP